MIEQPDILVLGGGGRQGDAWMTGLLAGLEAAHAVDLRACDYFVGTSAGSIVAAKLLRGRRPRRVDSGPPSSGSSRATADWQSPLPKWTADSLMAIAAPLAQLAIGVGRTPGEMLRRAALPLLPASAGDALDFREAFPPDEVRFDGRLRVAAVDRRAGRRVVFGSPGAPAATVAQALSASCALPLVFAPAVIGGREYVDGAVWSPTNADVAPVSRDAEVLILAPMASLYGPFNAPVRAASRATMLVEASALKMRGARVRIISPDRKSALSIGRDLMSGSDLEQTQTAGYAQGMSL